MAHNNVPSKKVRTYKIVSRIKYPSKFSLPQPNEWQKLSSILECWLPCIISHGQHRQNTGLCSICMHVISLTNIYCNVYMTMHMFNSQKVTEQLMLLNMFKLLSACNAVYILYPQREKTFCLYPLDLCLFHRFLYCVLLCILLVYLVVSNVTSACSVYKQCKTLQLTSHILVP